MTTPVIFTGMPKRAWSGLRRRTCAAVDSKHFAEKFRAMFSIGAEIFNCSTLGTISWTDLPSTPSPENSQIPSTWICRCNRLLASKVEPSMIVTGTITSLHQIHF